MRIKKLKYLLLTALFALFTSANADINIHEGEWEITNNIEMSGGLSMKMPSTTVTQCINKEKIVPKTDKKINKYCTISEQNIEGDTVTWKMQCKNNMHSEGSVTYHGETFEGTINTKTEIPNMGTMSMIIHMKGKRIGECHKE